MACGSQERLQGKDREAQIARESRTCQGMVVGEMVWDQNNKRKTEARNVVYYCHMEKPI